MEEASLNAQFPELTGAANNTPASDEVKRTNLQPQVDSQEITTKGKREADKILAIDGKIEQMGSELPDGDDNSEKVNRFHKLWDKMKAKWDAIKMSDELPNGDQKESDQDEGLGSTVGDEKYRATMQKNPNMVPNNSFQGPMVSYPSDA